ncbi:hypothetical protein [uncultured Helicobacter sp.]|uniref:hypothetical protein n=1 Tax=uncultured Helicobacter sp. TaxID=175537 RepID=UPI0037513029
MKIALFKEGIKVAKMGDFALLYKWAFTNPAMETLQRQKSIPHKIRKQNAHNLLQYPAKHQGFTMLDSKPANNALDCSESIKNLFSTQRLQSYTNTHQHFKNLVLIGKIATKLSALEICIRNTINTLLIERLGVRWLEEESEAEHRGRGLDNHQLLSRQNLGFWHKMATKHKLYKDIFAVLEPFEPTRYSLLNRDRFYHNGKKRFLRDTHKSEMILSCIHTIRNRCFHCENLLKTREIFTRDNNGHKLPISAPRITTIIKINDRDFYFGVMPDKIEVFLDDCLDLFDRDIRRYIAVAQGATNE